MAGSMKDIKLRIKSVESTMQITKAMELVASSKMRRAKERVEHSRPYFETLHETLTKIACSRPPPATPTCAVTSEKRRLLIVIAGDRGLAGGYNSNVLKQAEAEEGEVLVLPIGKRSAEFFVHHEVTPVHAGGAAGGRCLGGRVLPAGPPDHRRIPQGRVRCGKDLLHRVRFHDDPDRSHHGGAAAVHRTHRAAEGGCPPQPDPVQAQQRGSIQRDHPGVCGRHRLRCRVRERSQ